MPEGMLREAVESRADTAEWSIGLDFGTAFSKAAAARITFEQGAAAREVTPLRIGAAAGWNRPFLAPSSLYLDRVCVHFGPRAAERLHAEDKEGRELLRSFKMILGAYDFEHALDYFPTAAVDPDGIFRRGDLIVLYLAYLLALVDQAAAPRFAFESDDGPPVRLRYSRPGWMPDRIAAANEAMANLFVQAKHVYGTLGDALLDAHGLPYDAALAALNSARANATEFTGLDGGIYEASAVGVCHYSDPTAPNYMVIVDIGAGTTDVAGLLRVPHRGNIRVVRAARRTIDVAGDSFDAALMHLFLAKGKRFKSRSERSALWRSVLPHIRDLKEEIFEKGVVAITFRGVTISCTARELVKQPHFKAALKDITKLYEKSLKEVAQVGRRDGSRAIGVVLAGGGSRLPAIQKMVQRKRWMGLGVRVESMPTTPAWANQLKSAHEWENLFAQLSVAFGAAISGPEQANSPPV